MSAHATLKDRESTANVLQHGFGLVFGFLMIFVIISIMGVASEALVAIGALFLGMTFIFGSSLEAMWHCLLVIFVIAPFRNGENVEFGGDIYNVEKINVFTTRMIQGKTGKVVFINNANLFKTDVINHSKISLRGTKTTTIDYTFWVDGTTDIGSLEQFEKEAKAFFMQDAANSRRKWVIESYFIHFKTAGEDNANAKLQISIQIEGVAWADGGLRTRATTIFTAGVRGCLLHSRINLTTGIQPYTKITFPTSDSTNFTNKPDVVDYDNS